MNMESKIEPPDILSAFTTPLSQSRETELSVALGQLIQAVNVETAGVTGSGRLRRAADRASHVLHGRVL